MNRKHVIGVDVGGTFTDVFVLDESTGKVEISKVPSTRGDQSVGFMAGIRAKVPDLATVATVVHGTTVGTNALLERKGAKTGVITTRGFRDVLEMRRRDRPTTWGLWGTFEPVVPRDLRLEVAERTLADGTIHTAVDLDQVRAAAKTLIEKGCEAVALIFVNAFANDANERAAAEALRAVWPNPHVSISTELLPEIREFERASTTALNAYLQPPVGSYLQRLENRLKEGGSDAQILIVQSNGGVMSVESARRRPVRTALSGPAAGVIACQAVAVAAGFPNVITCDMGGTSFDVSLIANGEAALAAQTSIDFGMVVRTPMIEIVTIGAGGGSIAGLDRGGLLQIGPESAGSDPGPVCYGKGNTRPTVTDANVVMGRIDAERPIGGGKNKLDVAAAKAAIETHVGKPLGLDTMAAAEAIIRVANARMAGAIRLVSIERGFDPRDFAIMPFGGGGSLHVSALMREVGLGRALVPRFPGVTSALGCVIADMRHDFVRTVNRVLDQIDMASLAQQAKDAAEEGGKLLDAAGVGFASRSVRLSLDMHYLGQTHTLSVPLEANEFTTKGVMAAFERAYEAAFGRTLKGVAAKVLNLRVAAIGHRPKFDLRTMAPTSTTMPTPRHRDVWMEGAWHKTAIYPRMELPVGAKIAGPAILEQPDTTILVEPGFAAQVDAFGNLVIERG
ncbi:MAG: hydantoinase/oxoprolinase family protein [Alphaproteobacteria bacterium]|nr:hydantoinase/oxoprolinase family protein [Alphaproteobacteria bacterium]